MERPWPISSVCHPCWKLDCFLLEQVFRWHGYFKEAVPESPIETYRVRRVVIHYYLVDDTIDVEEPKQLNSGIDQVPTA